MRNETRDPKKVALVLPMFYEYAQRVRQGILDWVDEHGGWQIVEIDPATSEISPDLRPHLDGLVLWYLSDHTQSSMLLNWGLPTAQIGMREATENSRGRAVPMRVSFDRASINDLAIKHFHSLGIESIGYVGQELGTGRHLALRVKDLKSKVLAAGKEWHHFDLGSQHPVLNPALTWQGTDVDGLQSFLENLPPSTGLLAQDDYIGTMLCESARSLDIDMPGTLAVLGQGDRTIGRSGPCPLSTVEIPGQLIGREVAALLDQWMTGQRPDPATRLISCDQILIRQSTGGLSGNPQTESAKRHFDRHALDGVTVGELAAITGCAPQTLRRRFREAYGFEIAEEARKRRLEEALRLLEQDELEIREIGQRCGFPHPPNFFNFIHRQTGMGPNAYREQAQKKRPPASTRRLE